MCDSRGDTCVSISSVFVEVFPRHSQCDVRVCVNMWEETQARVRTGVPTRGWEYIWMCPGPQEKEWRGQKCDCRDTEYKSMSGV